MDFAHFDTKELILLMEHYKIKLVGEVQSHKLNFLKPSYFYKIIVMFSEESGQPVHLRSDQSSPHALKNIVLLLRPHSTDLMA